MGKTYQRKNITCACDMCRQAKVRCNGNKPSCDRCTTKNLTCFYPIQKKRGFPKKIKKETPKVKQNEVILLPPREHSFEQEAKCLALLGMYMDNFHDDRFNTFPARTILNPNTKLEKIMQLIAIGSNARAYNEIYMAHSVERAIEEAMWKIPSGTDRMVANSFLGEYYHIVDRDKSAEYINTARSLYFDLRQSHLQELPIMHLLAIYERLSVSLISVDPEITRDFQNFLSAVSSRENAPEDLKNSAFLQMVPALMDVSRSCFTVFTHRLDEQDSYLQTVPWLSLEQHEQLFKHFNMIEKQLGTLSHNLLAKLYLTYPMTLKCLAEEAVHNYEESAQYAYRAMKLFQKYGHLLRFCNSRLVGNLQALFKYFLRHSNLESCVEILHYLESVAGQFPRVSFLCEKNKTLLWYLRNDPQADLHNLFRNPVSLNSISSGLLNSSKSHPFPGEPCITP